MSTVPPLFRRGQPMHWILDWDGTITTKDTLDTLVHISSTRKPDFPTTDHWNRVSQAYMDDYSATLKLLVPDGLLPTTVRDEKRLLGQMRHVELRSLERVSDSGIFAGLTEQTIDEGAGKAIQSGQVQLRNHFSSFHKHVQESKGQTFNILSVNWSRHFIWSCLGAAGVTVPCDAIVSNELDSISAGEASGGRIVSAVTAYRNLIVSSGDKLQTLEQMPRIDAPKEARKGNSPKRLKD
ncbi:haloacid dehalogenase-like hydrolase protein [Stemphylium lycopersici]|uniref:Haloacid dehalogenase-like hydrolase protein n=1 Tax=Stemphylium lycopersici TaxID=183478 RepID=A0A364N6V2_STELY|nr:haloacid dehalogenase-like hydrolase protein [Stemphylium lycopersici]RAR12761.1 haloacid dehalogenase-like hydrolase protein [Stemphylium lycopersici]